MSPSRPSTPGLCVVNAGGRVSFPGLFLPVDPKGPNAQHKKGEQSIKMGQAFAKSVNVLGGQCPVKSINRELLRLILNKRLPKLTTMLNVQIVELGGAPKAYEIFNGGKPVKYLIDPHGMLKAILKGEFVNEFDSVRGKDPLKARQEANEAQASENGVSNTKTPLYSK